MKREINGKAVIYTADGVKVLDAEVKRYFNVYLEERRPKFDFDKEYLLIDCARTVPTDNIYAKPAYQPHRIKNAVNFAESKFFRFSLELMKLAQWQPIHSSNNTFGYDLKGVDYSREDLDAQLYRYFDFTPPMIDFVENFFK